MARPRIPSHIAKAVKKYREEHPGQGVAIAPAPGQRPDVFQPPKNVQTPQHEMAENQKQNAEARAAIPPSQGRTETYTYFTTQPGETVLLYSAHRWMNVRLILETAGPVDVSTRQELIPVGSGKGISLVTNVELSIALNENDRLYIAANAVNRVSIVIEPIPWLEQIAMMQAKALKG